MATQTHQEFLDWYQPIHEAFTRYCSSRAYAWMETEDLVQEAILATLRNYARIRDKEKLLGYMIGITNNILKNQWRKKQREANWDEKALARMESQIGNPELAMDIHDLHKAIQALSETQKTAILLFEISGFSIKEIAAIQETSEGAVKTRLSRARANLKKMLHAEEGASKKSLSKQLAAYASILL